MLSSQSVNSASKKAERNVAMPESLKEHRLCMRKLLDEGDHSDVSLSCSDGTTFKAHKAILCAHSEFFSKALQPEKFIEGYSGHVDLEVGDSAIIRKLLDYLYTTEYDNTSSIHTGLSPLWLDAKLHVAADFYGITSLKKETMANFEQSATKIFNQSASTQNLVELSAILQFIYENTADDGGIGIRGTAIKIIVRYATNIFDCDEGLKSLQDAMETSGAFGRDLSIAVLKKWRGFRKVQCQECWHIWADSRQNIPHGHCPGCQEIRHNWSSYQVE